MNNFRDTSRQSNKKLLGLIFLGIGCLLLIKTLDIFFLPGYLFSWPMWLIVIGFYLGTRRGFNRPAPLFLIALGFIFLANRILPDLEFDRFAWPTLIIGIGLWIILKPGRHTANVTPTDWDKRVFSDSEPEAATTSSSNEQPQPEGQTHSTAEDRLNSVSIFGGVKKNIVSKNFMGGEVVNFFGGSEINLMQADIQGKVKLEVTQVFGGTKIIIPANWTVHSEMVAIFGGIEDKRPPHASSDQKTLIIEGTSVFGGIDIRSF
ncbi:MAG TPA: DUF5668 domain-containing protein [Daejeonella sp.]|nr:DUF5668 domain-containing protein [Daejeonella sp.]